MALDADTWRLNHRTNRHETFTLASAMVGVKRKPRSTSERSEYTEATSSYVRAGDTYLWQSKYTEAEASYRQAREIYARIGDGGGEAKALYGLGDVHRHRSEHQSWEIHRQNNFYQTSIPPVAIHSR
ncbi:hypothetical protein M407DRAFT_35181 [Tulasnella calospora MUT 4182]|uniref:Uncharacterized protein n=1 Tax=Tulasnella calospora MUT 4182 TaxID=1051891 RepID=A0A0C3Q088_9AGAM|nr:hypothetical protein M407DRAFT_35181 [Tulasnella calospora MUT 4182]